MKKQESKKLVLDKQTVRKLQQQISDEQLQGIAGGVPQHGRPLSQTVNDAC